MFEANSADMFGLTILGITHTALGLFQNALNVLKRNAARSKEILRELNLLTLDAETRLALVYHHLRRYAEAADLLESLVERSIRASDNF
jgi:tetratricopeptide (TPR) repeat protein